MRFYMAVITRMASLTSVRGAAAAFVPLTIFLFLSITSSAQDGLSDLPCSSAEDCYRAAFDKPASAHGQNGPATRQLRLRQLEVVRERYPDSVWAKRSGLASALLLMERDPAESLHYFRTAQREMPVLEDYARLWMGEALLQMGDAQTAADLLEVIPVAVPDTLLTARVAYRTGEAWYKVGKCDKAAPQLARAVLLGPQEPAAPAALLNLADCHLRELRPADGLAALRQVWMRYPQTAEAKEAEKRLAQVGGAATWRPTPEEYYQRAQAFLALALHEDAVADLQKFLAGAPADARRGEAMLKLGTALVRLKRYEQAKPVFKALTEEPGPEADEATVWLARVYLRLGDKDRLLALPKFEPGRHLTSEQKATILILAGSWYEDQGQYDEALAQYRKVLQLGDVNGQKSDAQWRIGWVYYWTGRHKDAIEAFRELSKGKEDPSNTPKALYWLARSLAQVKDAKAAEVYLQLCRQYPLTYYCQLAQLRADPASPVPIASGASPGGIPGEGRGVILRDMHYQRAVELRLLGMDQDAAKEWASLTERYARDRATLAEISSLLSQAGAHHQALRIARLYFREGLERGGEAVPLALWSAAYPTVHLPAIRSHAEAPLDPYLVAAIIREESHYDPKAVSRVGAIGLMQIMPATAQNVAKKQGWPETGREELFDQDTNIRLGARYLGQLLQQFSGNVIHTVAAYNAGPQAVSAWTAKYGTPEPDEFVELIPYQETRQYVKRVLRSYREYRRLGGETCRAQFLDKVC
jgi:soluble lytic murein transglycosylase